jgi:acyl dehydratase
LKASGIERSPMLSEYQYFEDYEAGQTGVTRPRTVGETDITNFACITCDYSPVHVAHHANLDGPYGGRIAHGLLGTSLAAGLLSLDAPHLVGRGVRGGYLSGFDANYRDAILLGETVRIAWAVDMLADGSDRSNYGVIKCNFQVLNQDDKSFYDGHFLVKVPKHSTGEGITPSPDITLPAPWEVEAFSLDTDKIYNLKDFRVGEGGTTSGRTLTEADIVNFAGLTGDYNPLYVDDHYARTGPFGERIVPDLLAFNMAFGFWMRDSGVMRTRSSDTSKVAGHLNDSSMFCRPIHIGDTIRCRYRIEETRVSKTKPHLGIIRYGFQLLNQKDDVVQEGKTLMMRSTS